MGITKVLNFWCVVLFVDNHRHRNTSSLSSSVSVSSLTLFSPVFFSSLTISSSSSLNSGAVNTRISFIPFSARILALDDSRPSSSTCSAQLFPSNFFASVTAIDEPSKVPRVEPFP